jgi:hypothetical protein
MPLWCIALYSTHCGQTGLSGLMHKTGFDTAISRSVTGGSGFLVLAAAGFAGLRRFNAPKN